MKVVFGVRKSYAALFNMKTEIKVNKIFRFIVKSTSSAKVNKKTKNKKDFFLQNLYTL